MLDKEIGSIDSRVCALFARHPLQDRSRYRVVITQNLVGGWIVGVFGYSLRSQPVEVEV